MQMTWDDIENLRDQTFHRTPALQVRDIDEAESFVNEPRFCFAFKMNKSELPCMWHAAAGQRDPKYPQRVQHDPFIGLVWTAKDALAAEKKVYYGKALKKRPTFISLEFLPAFYLMQKRRTGVEDYVAEYMRGDLSTAAKRIMDAMLERSPMVTSELKMASAMANPDSRAVFDRGMAELQSKMYIAKIGEFYDPFTFLWDLFDRRFPAEVAASEEMTEEAARAKILTRYFKMRWAAGEKEIARLFDWPPAEISKILSELQQTGVIISDLKVQGEKKSVWASSKISTL